MKETTSNYPYFNISVKALKDGATNGYCRICGNYAPLTDDHIPPKSCGNKGRAIFSLGNKSVIMQNGFHCKTICATCNNELLGANLDKEYKTVYEKIKSFNDSGLYLPNNLLKIDVDVKKFFRCILAHFFAVAVYEKNLTIKQVLEKPIHDDFISKNCRPFVLGKENEIKNVDIYYWFYPYSNIMINPFFGYVNNFFSDPQKRIYGAMIKFYPIGLFILDKKASTDVPNGIAVDFNVNRIFLNMKDFPKKEYLEHPTKEGVMLISDKIINGEKQQVVLKQKM